MSWFFGSTKKKELPPVTIDPTPIDNGFYCVNNGMQTQPSQAPMYPNLNGANPMNPPYLPYGLKPNFPTSSSSGATTSTITPARPTTVEPSNQLESIPFRIASELQVDLNIINDDNGLSLREFTTSLNKAKELFNSAEFNYDFELEKRILREAKLVNGGHVTF